MINRTTILKPPARREGRQLAAGIVWLAMLLTTIVFALGARGAEAAVLPEDRVDVLYHRYDGDDITIDGPSVLVRKKIGKNFSLDANYYVDTISSASIDVRVAASRYEEERTQYSVGATYLHNKTIMNAGFVKSDENDFEAETWFVGISQDMFGDLTTVSMSYARGNDIIRATGSPDFEETADRQSYSVGLTQVLTRSLIAAVQFETITDEGWLNNPYRFYRFPNETGDGFLTAQEIYPNTRTSNATAVTAKYYLPYRAAVHGRYRYYTDTFGIVAHTGEIGYTHPWGNDWIFSLALRHYTQTQADFYADLFPFQDSQNFLARDKEMSTFQNNTVTLGVVREFDNINFAGLEKGTVNLFWDFTRYTYDNFRDATVQGVVPGTEPLFEFDANVARLYVSFWF
ncbi:MAG: DUF3570 domain-containing protein [Pseudomonadota bacterium]